MRIPLANNLVTRDGTLTKDAKIVNGFVESRGDDSAVFKRPGTTNLGPVGTGLGQLLTVWNESIYSVVGDELGQSLATSGAFTGRRLFCAIATQSNNISATSPDGATWTLGGFPAVDNWSAIAYNNTVFCAVAGLAATYSNSPGATTTQAATSADGLTWTLRTLPVSANWSAIAWNGIVFCAIAYNSTIAATSPDGITWTQRTLPASANWFSIAWNGVTFVALSRSSVAATSADGITWIQQVALASNDGGLIASNGDFYAVNDGNTSGKSVNNGAGWLTGTLPSSEFWRGIAANNDASVIVAVSALAASSRGAISADGLTWTPVTTPAALWRTVVHNGFEFCTISGGYSGVSAVTSNVAATSVNGVSWTARTLPASASWSAMCVGQVL